MLGGFCVRENEREGFEQRVIDFTSSISHTDWPLPISVNTENLGSNKCYVPSVWMGGRWLGRGEGAFERTTF